MVMVKKNPRFGLGGTIVKGEARLSSISGTLVEGSTGNIARLTITNTSTKAGQPVAYTFGLTGVVTVGGYGVLNINEQLTVAAGATITKDYAFSIPSGIYGAGSGQVTLMNTVRSASFGNALASFTVSQAAPDPNQNVTVILRAYRAPSNAAKWIFMCNAIPYFDPPYPAISSPITKTVPANTPRMVIFGAFDAADNMIQSPNAWNGVGFSRLFENGKTYYWDFQTGLLLDSSYQMMF